MTESLLLVTVVLLSVALLAAVVILWRSMSRPELVVSTARDTTSDVTAMLELELDREFEPGDLLVAAVPDDPTLAIAIGDLESASRFGIVVGPLPRQLAHMAIGIDAAVKLGIEAGQRAGMLVRLTPDSTAKLRAFGALKDSSGAAFGVLKGSDGRFVHIVRFTRASGLQALGGVTGLMSTLAMQAQLAAIEHKLAELSENVQQIQVILKIEVDSEVAAVEGLLIEVYGAATTSGTLTGSMWSQIAPLVWIVRKHEEFADRRLQMLRRQLREQEDAVERRRWLEQHGTDLIEALVATQRQARIAAQLSALRLWHLTVVGDPSLPYYLSDLRRLSPKRQERLHQHALEMDRVLEQMATLTKWDRWLSPWASGAVVKHVSDIRTSLQNISGLPADLISSSSELDLAHALEVDATEP